MTWLHLLDTLRYLTIRIEWKAESMANQIRRWKYFFFCNSQKPLKKYVFGFLSIVLNRFNFRLVLIHLSLGEFCLNYSALALFLFCVRARLRSKWKKKNSFIHASKKIVKRFTLGQFNLKASHTSIQMFIKFFNIAIVDDRRCE